MANVGVEYLGARRATSVLERRVERERRRGTRPIVDLLLRGTAPSSTSALPSEVFSGRVYQRSRYTSAHKALRCLPDLRRFIQPTASCYQPTRDGVPQRSRLSRATFRDTYSGAYPANGSYPIRCIFIPRSVHTQMEPAYHTGFKSLNKTKHSAFRQTHRRRTSLHQGKAPPNRDCSIKCVRRVDCAITALVLLNHSMRNGSNVSRCSVWFLSGSQGGP